LAIEKNLKWLGTVRGDDLLRLYDEADLTLLLSKSENFGTVVAESLAMGTPAIVTTNSALREFTKEPGCYGIEYPPDPVKLAEMITEIVERKDGVGSLSDRIQTWDKIAERYERFYDRVIQERV
jgi:glycosyltransferase involved in cell wall biosynthesis